MENGSRCVVSPNDVLGVCGEESKKVAIASCSRIGACVQGCIVIGVEHLNGPIENENENSIIEGVKADMGDDISEGLSVK